MQNKKETSRLLEIESKGSKLVEQATKASYFVTQNRDISPDEITAYTNLFGTKGQKNKH